MSGNIQSVFADRDNISNLTSERRLLGYRETTQNCSLVEQEVPQTIQVGTMRSIDACRNAHPDTSKGGQANNATSSENCRVNIGHDCESNEFDAYGRVQIPEEQFCNQTIDPKIIPDFQTLPASSLEKSTNRRSLVALYARNQSLEPTQNRDNHYGPPSISSPAGVRVRSRFGGGELHSRRSKSSMSVDISYGNQSHGHGKIASYSSQFSTPTQMFDNGSAGSAYTTLEGEVETNFRKSSATNSGLEFNNDRIFSFDSHPSMEFSDAPHTVPSVVHTNDTFMFQPEVQDLGRSQIHEYGGAPVSGSTHSQPLVPRTLGSDAPNEEDIDEYSDSYVNSPTSRDIGSMVDGDFPSRSEMRILGASISNTNQFKGHFDRAAHQVGRTRQKVGKAPPKKAKGATDPENTKIVDLYDNHNWLFSDIAQHLNVEREKKGMTGRFTPNSVHNRYNRSAPIIYKADGRVFVAIKDRKHHTQDELDSLSSGAHTTVWNKQMDRVLAQVVADYEADKWRKVAEVFNATTGQSLHASTVSTRFGMLGN